MLWRIAESSVTNAEIPTPPETAAEFESEGVWTGWINDMDPYEEGHKGDLEIRRNMDPVSYD